MLDSKVVLIGFLLIGVGWGLQTIDSHLGENVGTVLQLAGTVCVITGVVVVAFGGLRFMRRVEKSIHPQG